jgi:hypothetical protein
MVGPAPARASNDRATAAPGSAVPGVPGPTLPDLNSATPLDGGTAVEPRTPLRQAPESGRSRLGAAEVVDEPLTFTFKATAYGINLVPRDRYPYARTTPTALVDTGVKDATGVRMHKIGNTLYNHPVAQAQYGIANLESYIISQDQRYLDRARLQAQRLIDTADKIGSAWYLPYPFDFYLHGYQTDRRAAPWYSAMAQGQAITLFVRLFEVTGDEAYRNAADGLFASFLRPRGTSNPWVVWVDSQQHLWLEEFPGQAPDRTLNGHMFATFGMWDYWRLNQDDRAKKLYQGGLTTVVDYMSLYRNEKWISQYCLSHPTVLSTKYHLIHIAELFDLFGLARNVTFVRLAEQLSGDYPPPTVKGSVLFAAGTHEGVVFTSAGTVSSRKKLTLSRASTAPADRRERIKGQPGYWYRITAGSLAGHHVQEKWAISTLQGRSVTYQYYPARRVTMAANATFTGFVFNDNGSVASQQSVTTTAVTPFGAIASAIWNGREYLLAETGPLAGRWIYRAVLTV